MMAAQLSFLKMPRYAADCGTRATVKLMCENAYYIDYRDAVQTIWSISGRWLAQEFVAKISPHKVYEYARIEGTPSAF